MNGFERIIFALFYGAIYSPFIPRITVFDPKRDTSGDGTLRTDTGALPHPATVVSRKSLLQSIGNDVAALASYLGAGDCRA